jgi:hypothetical protein
MIYITQDLFLQELNYILVPSIYISSGRTAYYDLTKVSLADQL